MFKNLKVSYIAKVAPSLYLIVTSSYRLKCFKSVQEIKIKVTVFRNIPHDTPDCKEILVVSLQNLAYRVLFAKILQSHFFCYEK